MFFSGLRCGRPVENPAPSGDNQRPVGRLDGRQRHRDGIQHRIARQRVNFFVVGEDI
jgi:hypothetical protein